MRVLRGWIVGMVTLLMLVTLARAQYQAETVFVIRRPTATTSAPWVTVSGDSGSVAALYPCENGALADSVGRRVDLTWYAAIGGWVAEVDITGDYSVFYRTGCCAETLAVALQCRRLWGPTWPSALIANPEAFEAGVIDAAAIAAGAITPTKIYSTGSPSVADFNATGPDSIKFNNLVADQLLIHDAFTVKTAAGASTIQGPLVIDVASSSALNVTSSGKAEFDGAVNIDGIVTMTNASITLGNDVGDQITIEGDLLTQDDMSFGNSTGDDATFTGGIVANHTVALGDATSDAITIIGDFTAEGDFDTEDSLAVATDFTAADSTKSALRIHNGWIEISSMSSKDFSISNGTLAQTFSWPGLRSNDCIVCDYDDGTTSTSGSRNYRITYTTGKVTFTRDASSGIVSIRCIGFKR